MDRRAFTAGYGEFFRLPDVAVLAGVAFVARMYIGMVGLAMLLFLHDALGSYAQAGGLCGVYFVAMAIGAPILGRLIDRTGPKPILLVTTAVQPASLAAVLILAMQGAGAAALGVAAALAGAVATPIAALTRAVWRHRFTAEADLKRAFALDAVTIEANYTLGPAIVAGVLTATDAATAFALAIGCALAGPIVFASSPALRYFRPGPDEVRHLLGPLAEPRLRLVFVATFGLGAGFGFLEVGYPGYATSLGTPALGGVFLSMCSLGSAAMGIVFGGLTLRAAIERQFAVAAGLMALPLALHVWLDSPVAFAAVAFVAGASIAPSLACQSVLVSRLAPNRYATEAFTWSSTCIMTGVGAGVALGGWLIETQGARLPFAAGTATMGAVAVIALRLARPGSARPASRPG